MGLLPEFGGEVDDGGHKGTDDGDDGGEAGFGFVGREVGTEDEIGDIHEEEDEGGGQFGFAGPPLAPDGSGPDYTGDEHKSTEYDADFSGGVGDAVGEGFTADQEDYTGDGDDDDGDHGDPGERDVKVEDALYGTLVDVGWDPTEYHPESDGHSSERGYAEGGYDIEVSL